MVSCVAVSSGDMPIELILFPKRPVMRALRVGADKRCDMNVGKMSFQSASAFERGLRDAFWPRALTSASPLREYVANAHIAKRALTARPVSVHIKKKILRGFAPVQLHWLNDSHVSIGGRPEHGILEGWLVQSLVAEDIRRAGIQPRKMEICTVLWYLCIERREVGSRKSTVEALVQALFKKWVEF